MTFGCPEGDSAASGREWSSHEPRGPRRALERDNWKKAFFGWLVFAVAAFVVGTAAGHKDVSQSETASGEAAKAEWMLEQANFEEPAREAVLIQGDRLTVDDPAFRATIAGVSQAVAIQPDVTDIENPLLKQAGGGQISRDRRSVLVQFDISELVPAAVAPVAARPLSRGRSGRARARRATRGLAKPRDSAGMEPVVLPGFVNAHSHTFQRALRGRRTGGDFWAWRETMIEEAERQTPETVRESYAETYREMRAAGYTAVGEFHYLGVDEARAAAEAARAVGVELTLLLTAYARGGSPRFRQDSVGEYLRQVEELRAEALRVGCAPHSVRACPPDWIEQIGRYAAGEDLPLHVHADEQPREIEECLAEHGLRPIELLDRAGCLGPRSTIVHATHADDAELDLLATSGSRVCVCPTTEANLGDGFAPFERLRERGIGICVGSDSNVRIDPLEELRELETTARRVSGRREVCDAGTLLCFGADEGAAALGIDTWPEIEIDPDHPSLRGIDRSDLLDALVFGCCADVVVG